MPYQAIICNHMQFRGFYIIGYYSVQYIAKYGNRLQMRA
jgi:hypothetical protein